MVCESVCFSIWYYAECTKRFTLLAFVRHSFALWVKLIEGHSQFESPGSHFIFVSRAHIPQTPPPSHPFPSLMWGCICPANPSASAALLPVSVGSQLLRAFVPRLLPAQPFVITTLRLGGGRSVMMLLPPSQLSHMQLCAVFVEVMEDELLKLWALKKSIVLPLLISWKTYFVIIYCIYGNGWKSISGSSEVDVVDLWPDPRSEPHFELSTNGAMSLCDSVGWG